MGLTAAERPWRTRERFADLGTAVLAGDWNAARRALDGSTPEVLSAASAYVACLPGTETSLERVLVTHPDLLARAFLAERYVALAWAVRGRARAVHVAPERWRGFFEALEVAERHVAGVLADDPDNLPALTTSLLTARGLELGTREKTRRHERVRELAPDHVRAHQIQLVSVCPRWGGDWRTVDALVRDLARDVPEGAPTLGLEATREVERFVEDQGRLRAPQVRDALVRAAGRSVLSPVHTDGPGSEIVHAQLAFAFSFGGHHALARPHFGAVDPALVNPVVHTTRTGWAYLGSPWHFRWRRLRSLVAR